VRFYSLPILFFDDCSLYPGHVNIEVIDNTMAVELNKDAPNE